MKLVMARIDDRLIHGQVIIGCCAALSVGRILLANDVVAAEDALAQLYASSVPTEIECVALGVSEAANYLLNIVDDIETLLLTSCPADMLTLVEAGVALPDGVCLGGLHHAAERPDELRGSGVFVGSADLDALEALRARGLAVRVQSVPVAKAIDLDELLPPKTP